MTKTTEPNRTQTGELACAFGEPWLGRHPLCAAEVARVCGVPVESVRVSDLSKYRPAPKQASFWEAL